LCFVSPKKRLLANLLDSELLAKTSEEVLTEFKAKENQLEQTLQSFKSMQLPIEQLLTASKQQSEVFGNVIETLKLGRETQKKILAAVQNTNRIANGCFLCWPLRVIQGSS
jgi:hypothetical protein